MDWPGTVSVSSSFPSNLSDGDAFVDIWEQKLCTEATTDRDFRLIPG